MPTYVFKCKACEVTRDLFLSMKSLDSHREICDNCDEVMSQVITGGRGFYQRSPFPSEEWETASWEPMRFKDKKHLADHCEEKGFRSKLLEDGDVPL